MVFRFLLTQLGTRVLALTLAVLGATACSDLPDDEGTRDAGAYVPSPPFMPVCFAAGTLIATPSGALPIEQLAEGHAVWSFDPAKNQLVEGRVSATITRSAQAYGTLPVPNDAGTVLQVTPEHPVFARGRYIKAKCVRAGDELRLLSDGGVRPAVARAGFAPIPDASTTVYNLTVSPHENYFAGDLLVHNKSACGPSCGWSGCPCPPSCGTTWGIHCAPGCPCFFDAGVNVAPFDAAALMPPRDAGPFASPLARDAGSSDAGDECEAL